MYSIPAQLTFLEILCPQFQCLSWLRTCGLSAVDRRRDDLIPSRVSYLSWHTLLPTFSLDPHTWEVLVRHFSISWLHCAAFSGRGVNAKFCYILLAQRRSFMAPILLEMWDHCLMSLLMIMMMYYSLLIWFCSFYFFVILFYFSFFIEV